MNNTVKIVNDQFICMKYNHNEQVMLLVVDDQVQIKDKFLSTKCLETKKAISPLREDSLAIAFNQSRTIMKSGCRKDIIVWKFDNGKMIKEKKLLGHTSWVYCLVYSKKFDWFVSVVWIKQLDVGKKQIIMNGYVEIKDKMKLNGYWALFQTMMKISQSNAVQIALLLHGKLIVAIISQTMIIHQKRSLLNQFIAQVQMNLKLHQFNRLQYESLRIYQNISLLNNSKIYHEGKGVQVVGILNKILTKINQVKGVVIFNCRYLSYMAIIEQQ